jgi:orotate phosphoribosyltransferase
MGDIMGGGSGTGHFEWSEKRRLELQTRELLSLAERKGFKFTDKFFPYTSGQIGGYFVQSIDITGNGQAYRSAIDALAEVVNGVTGEFDVISGGESRDWDFSNPVAYALGKPHAKLYKDPAKNPALGAGIRDQRIVHVADLQNEGSSIRDCWLPQIQEAGGKLVHAVFYVDRLEDGVEVMRELGIPSDAVIRLDKNAWQTLLDNGVISREVYDSLNKRLEDKTKWAHDMLRGNIDHLIGLCRDPKTTAKADKILDRGYPELRDELKELMLKHGYRHGPEIRI